MPTPSSIPDISHTQGTLSLEDLEGPTMFFDPSTQETPPPPVEPTNVMEQTAPALSQFPERWQADYIGLIYLGYLEEEVQIPHHKFLIRTLTVGEKIQVSRIVKDVQDTLGFNRAYKAAVVAAGLLSVDGMPIVTPEKNKPLVRDKYEYVICEWHDMIVDLLYRAIDKLELRAIQVGYELGLVAVNPNIQPEEVAIEEEPPREF
jgi:hypothetical protein